MTRALPPKLAAVSGCAAGVALGLGGCATAPVQTAGVYASDGVHYVSRGAEATYHVASTGARTVYSTGSDVYAGVGTAAKQPFRDFNMMQDPIPMVLLRAVRAPYDMTGLNSCDDITNKVAELDLALGPDLDSPKDRRRDRLAQGAGDAATAALDAASSAAEGFLPMRSVIKRVSGASRYEDHMKHAVLAGTVRRGFLKAIGMQHNCSWPAAPLWFHPQVVTIAAAPLALPPLAAPSQATVQVRYAALVPAASMRRTYRRRMHGSVLTAAASPAGPPAPALRFARAQTVAPQPVAPQPVQTQARTIQVAASQTIATQTIETQAVARQARSPQAGMPQAAFISTATEAPASGVAAEATPVSTPALSPSAGLGAPWSAQGAAFMH